MFEYEDETVGSGCSLEAASQDMGLVPAGWTDNFAIGRIRVGRSSSDNPIAGNAQGPVTLDLLSEVDNDQDLTYADEAVYVDTLEIAPGGTFDLNGLNLFYLNGGDPKRLIMGDINLDGLVDAMDVSLLQHGATNATWQMGDFNGDRLVDADDIGTLLSNWTGDAGPLTGVGTVPEPAAATILLSLGFSLLRRRRGD